MKVLITKANDSSNYSIREFKTFQDFVSYSNYVKNDLILTDNYWYNKNIESIQRCCEVSKKIAKQMTKIKYSVIIYNDYIE